MKHILHPPLGRKSSSCHDMLFLSKRLTLEERCIHCQRGVTALWEFIIGFCPLPELAPKSWETVSCCLCHRVQPIPSGVTGTSNSNGSHAWEMPRALTCFISSFAFSKASCCSESQSHTCPFLTRQHSKGGPVPGGE